MATVKIAAQILDAATLQEKANEVAKQPEPAPPAGLSDKTHWMQVIMKNKTQFNISLNNPPFLDSGKYWNQPQEQVPFSRTSFGVCNRDLAPAGATGGTAFKLHLDLANSYDFAVGWTAPVLGAYTTSVVASSMAEDGYKAARPEGNSLMSDNVYEGTDAQGNAARFRLKFSASIAKDHLALVVVEQVSPEST